MHCKIAISHCVSRCDGYTSGSMHVKCPIAAQNCNLDIDRLEKRPRTRRNLQCPMQARRGVCEIFICSAQSL